jgi:hypothetical protein
MESIQRLNYFTSQFLEENDFQDEQAYHREMRHRHNRSLHTPGVVEGLEVSKVGDRQISISPGMAIDRDGQEMIFLEDSGAISPSGAIALSGAKTDVFVTIQYGESKEVQDTTSGVGNQFRRVEEKPVIAFSNSNDSSAILLAIVTLDNSGTIVDKPNNQVKTMATAKVAPKAIGSEQLGDSSVRGNAIAPQAVGTSQLTDLAVTTEKVASKAIGAEQLEDRAIAGNKIAVNGIATEHLQNGAVNEEKLSQSVKDSIRASGVVKGMIIMWSGSITSIPQGWALCNGANGTPNLINRFIMGLGSDGDPKTGGSQEHSHNITAPVSDVPKTTALGGASFELAGKNHTHNTLNANHLPPFFKLAFIMKL